MAEGFDKCVNILFQVGEYIPPTFSEEIYRDEVVLVKKLLKGISRKELLSLPLMTDSRKLAAMQFLNHALSLTYICNPSLNPIIVFRMVKLSIQHGVCNISAFAFACYGGWLVSAPCSDFEGGYRMGRVATEMMKRLNATEVC